MAICVKNGFCGGISRDIIYLLFYRKGILIIIIFKQLKQMKYILNKTRKSSDRKTLINEPMGCYGLPKSHANYYLSIATGIDRGLGYQGYSSVSYFLENCKDEGIRDKIKEIVKTLGYTL